MKGIILSILISFSALPIRAQLQEDKVKHFAAGAMSGAIGADIADRISGGNRYWRIAGALASSLMAGLAKEAYDEHIYNGWDNRDLTATIMGGVTVGITIDIFSERKHRRNKELLFSLSNRKAVYREQ
jgi:uncharacterized protein YfiM (DUF2279 family)